VCQRELAEQLDFLYSSDTTDGKQTNWIIQALN
jgi:hypothetical protein